MNFVIETDPFVPKMTPFKRQGLSFFWWNIQHGQTNRRIIDSARLSAIDQNLQRLVQEDTCFDVLILAEYADFALDDLTKEMLHAAYQHRVFIPYNPKIDYMKIAVFSSVPLTELETLRLGFIPDELGAGEARAYERRWASGFPEAKGFERHMSHLQISRHIDHLQICESNLTAQ